MTFLKAENYLISLANMPRNEYMKDPKMCGVYLERTKFFLKLLGCPEKKIPHYVHITGTSGKGSVANLISSVLTADGKKTGTLVSPHPSTILERWQIDGKTMSEKEFIAIVKEIKPIFDEFLKKSPYDMVSFHELTDIIGFYYFAKNKVEWGVLEVGMGGRYCSSNIIPHKDVAVITNIGWDHKDLIGPTKKNICLEKSGIINTKCTVYTMEKKKNLREIIKEESKKHKADFHFVEAKGYKIIKNDLTGVTFEYKNNSYSLPTPGEHQIKNAILVIEACVNLDISTNIIKKGFSEVVQPLRMEVLKKNPYIIVDGAHNEDKMATSVKTLINYSKVTGSKSKIHLLVGFSGDKDFYNMVKQLATLKPKSIACTRNTINIFRKVADPTKIYSQFKKISKAKIKMFLDPADALFWSRKQLGKGDILLITGSVFLGGEIRGQLTKEK